MRGTATGGRLVVASALLAAALSGLGVAAGAAGASPKVLDRSLVHQLVPGTKVLRALGADRRIDFAVVLPARHTERLAALLAAQQDPASPLFHRFISPDQFAARFGATRSQLARVTGWLRVAGIATTEVSHNRLVVTATAKVATLSALLGTSFSLVQLPSGRRAYANRTAPSVPASLADVVEGVVGLDNLAILHDNLARPTPRRAGALPALRAPAVQRGPHACGAAASSAWSFGGFTADRMAQYYGMSPLYGLGALGAGVRVAIAEFESNSLSDIAAFQRCFHTTTTVNYLPQPGFADAGPGQGEAALDIENVIGMAPRATIDVFQAANTDAADLAMFSAIVASGDQVITTSWGSCEPETTPSLITAEATLYQQAAAQGQVAFAASGDAGSTDCFPSQVSSNDDDVLAVDDPASQPYVIGVGGTTALSKGERVWNDGGGGSGGGVSQAHCMPEYQSASGVHGVLDGAYTRSDALLCPGATSYLREVPDVSAVADPSTGYTVYWAGAWTNIGGTSAGSPLWAAATALINTSPYCTSLGASAAVSASSLYRLAGSRFYASGFRDVTLGDNAIVGSGYTGSLYPAHLGFDEASGLGTPSFTAASPTSPDELFRPGLASLLCRAAVAHLARPEVTNLVPRSIASTRPTRVAIVGSGFWGVRGAVRVAVAGVTAPATCPTDTRCYAVLPGLAPRTAHLRVLIQTVAVSPAVPPDLVTFLRAPRIGGISPAIARPGTPVVIYGRGFEGRVSVRFGAEEATTIRVVDAGRLVVVVPPGAGTVKVSVAARGGRSEGVVFRYG